MEWRGVCDCRGTRLSYLEGWHRELPRPVDPMELGPKLYWGNRKWKDWGPGGNSEAEMGVWCLVGNFEIDLECRKTGPSLLEKGKEWEGNDGNNG